ncbi:hypothetical protein ACFU5O_06795 [Streptomyces sp. NPDC057445]|uniref:hypothetical protein n=1 Tax=Streptomyces sp. NPDC057445 TaxID=3346136 RepID=UPI003695C338
MSAQLRETAGELAEVLWREHTVYRDRTGGVVIRGEHVQRWISIGATGGRGEVLLRAGRILDGGTTAPARVEAVASLTAGTAELAAVCRRLLAETAADAGPSAPPRAAPAGTERSGRSGPSRRSGPFRRSRRSVPGQRHTGLGSWAVILCVIGMVALYVHLTTGAYR